MRALHAWCVLGALGAGACLDVPAHNGAIDAAVDAPVVDAPPCGSNALDCDDDGWVADALNPAADDCNDFNATIHPGARDDPGTTVDEDCIADGPGARMVGVSGDEAGWQAGALSINFGTATRMPASMRIGGVEALGTETSCVTTNEEGIGASLYPAFAAHVRTTSPTGDLVVERRGPAMATSLVTWAVDVPVTGNGPLTCNVATSIVANIRFTVLANQRLIRDDSITVNTGVQTCIGCGSPATAPILSSYLALDGSYDQVSIDGAAEIPLQFQMLQTTGSRVCVRQTTGTGRVGVTWNGVGARVRLRRTADNNSAMVFDWVNSMDVMAGNRRLTTSMVAATDDEGPCDAEMQDAVSEMTSPPVVQGLTFDGPLGVYRPTQAATGVTSFQALATIERGFTVLVPSGFDARGVTVWRQPTGGAAVRQIRDFQYLLQASGGEVVVFMPRLNAGDRITIAGPGHEPMQ